jgi:hypothetical protein
MNLVGAGAEARSLEMRETRSGLDWHSQRRGVTPLVKFVILLGHRRWKLANNVPFTNRPCVSLVAHTLVA